MAKLIVRTTLLTLLTCFTALVSKAQIGYDYAQYDLGVAVGYNQFYGDVLTSKSTKSVSFNFNYNQTAFINYIFEFQAGKLAGGSINDPFGRIFSADYQYYAFRLQLQAGQFIDYSDSPFANAMKNLYAGTGIGLIFDNIPANNINRYSQQYPGYYTPGLNKSQETFLPIRLGYEFKIFNQYRRPDVKIDVGYQYNFVFGDELDGFKAGHLNDGYSQISIGVKFAIGGVTSNNKQIDY